MSSDKTESLSDVWAARYDDRDDEELAHKLWAHKMTLRDRAMAQPFKNFSMPDEVAPARDLREAANDSKPKS